MMKVFDDEGLYFFMTKVKLIIISIGIHISCGNTQKKESLTKILKRSGPNTDPWATLLKVAQNSFSTFQDVDFDGS